MNCSDSSTSTAPDSLPNTADADVVTRESEHPAKSGLAGLPIISGLTFLSRILGLLRDAGMAALFGTGPLLDAFSVAFRLPNLARRLFGEGAMTAVFLPLFIREREQFGAGAAWDFTRRMILWLAVLLTALVLLGQTFLGGIRLSSAAGGELRLLCELSMILLPYTVLVCVAAQFVAVLQAHERFFVAALLPIVLNVTWLAAIWCLSQTGWASLSQMYGIAWAILIAGSLQVLVPLPALSRLGFRWRSDGEQSVVRIGEVFRRMIPVLAGLSITQLNALIDGLLAWGLAQPSFTGFWSNSARTIVESGTASALYLGQRLYQFPLGVFGVALGTVLFPRFARHRSRSDQHAFRSDLTLGLQLIIVVGLPAAAGMMFLADPLTTLLFARGEFIADDIARTSSAVVAYAAGIPAACGLLVVTRAYFACDDRTTPMRVGLFAVGVNLAFNAVLVHPLGGAGLAWASTIATTVQFLILSRRIGGLEMTPRWRQVFITLGKTMLATGGMLLICLLVDRLLQRQFSLTVRTGSVVIAGIAAFGGLAIALRLRCLLSLIGRQRDRI